MRLADALKGISRTSERPRQEPRAGLLGERRMRELSNIVHPRSG